MTPPRRAAGNVVDFQHAMVQRLKTENEKLQAAQDYLIGTARSNQSIQSRVHDARLAILRAPSFESMIHTLTGDLAILLDADAVTTGVSAGDVPAPQAYAPGTRSEGRGVGE